MNRVALVAYIVSGIALVVSTVLGGSSWLPIALWITWPVWIAAGLAAWMHQRRTA
ncbi:hypothetical protein [Streptomyces sp. NPDC005953]|uniref:hypothetical protein n=1 Tax=Streptomyces sp. NPDC005953 TaxID=3156719 RepID=UPI00340125C3